jgi:TetR/AcrR family transcriptional repressor of nem operon
MGHSKAEKDESHQRIVKTAATRFREAGLHGIGISDLMKEAGLTHGGFYRHFRSRDDLVHEAVACALAESDARVHKKGASGQPPKLSETIDTYLSTAHRDAPGQGCAVAALGSDIARADPATRSTFTAHIRRNIESIGHGLEAGSPVQTRRQATLVLSALVGALTLARAVDDDSFSEDILRNVAAALKESLGGSRRSRGRARG